MDPFELLISDHRKVSELFEKIPDDLHPSFPGGADLIYHAGKIIFIRSGFNQMPANPVAGGANSDLNQSLIILQGKFIMLSVPDHINPLAPGITLGRTFKTADQKTLKQVGGLPHLIFSKFQQKYPPADIRLAGRFCFLI